MQYSQSKEKANEYASEALERIHAEGLAPVPQNFELWYVYYAGIDPEVVRAIDMLEANDQKITDERCEELHQRFLSESNENERVRQAGDQIQETIKGVKSRVSDIKNMTHEYSEALQSATGSLNDEATPDQIRSTLSTVLDSTQNVITHNQQLEEELERSTLVMQELQRDLELVKQQALTDGLTNLANRKAFDAEILRIAEEAQQNDDTFCLILMDIDHFKAFNDNYGHQVGDQVLRLVAQTLTDGVKGRDVAARYGGEEFAILLPQTNLQGGVKVADSLRMVVQGKELVNRNSGDTLGRVTLSAGIAQYVEGEPVENLIERADSALYTAKHNGRNQVASAPAPGQKK
ncbi:MAG: GGDEF domain-containing protein [Pseudomonadota bacterium]